MSDAETEGYRMSRPDNRDERDELKRQRLLGLAERASLQACSELPAPDPDEELVDFLFRVGVNIERSAKEGRPEVRFYANGIPLVPLHVMEAAIELLQLMGYRAEIKEAPKCVQSSGFPLTMIEVMEVYLAVGGWADN